jgi:hypothetical protein
LGFKNFKLARNHLSNRWFFHKNCLFLDGRKNQQFSESFFSENTETDRFLDSENFVRTGTIGYQKHQITIEHWKVPSAQKSLSSFS